jgi:hypothetical protein
MPKDEYSEYQKAVISDYYANLDAIMLERLSSLVSELYLADSVEQNKKLWQKARKIMEKLNIPKAIIEHIMEKRDEEILAKNLQDWLSARDPKKNKNRKK